MGRVEEKNFFSRLLRWQKIAISTEFLFFSKLCWGKAVVAYAMPQKKKEESERLIGERDQIKS